MTRSSTPPDFSSVSTFGLVTERENVAMPALFVYTSLAPAKSAGRQFSGTVATPGEPFSSSDVSVAVYVSSRFGMSRLTSSRLSGRFGSWALVTSGGGGAVLDDVVAGGVVPEIAGSAVVSDGAGRTAQTTSAATAATMNTYDRTMPINARSRPRWPVRLIWAKPR